VIEAFRSQTHARAIVQPEPPFLLLFLWDLQPFASPDTLNPFVVHMPTRVVQQAGHHPISVAPILIGQFDDVVGQAFFIGPALGHFALRGSVLPERAAGAAFRYAKLPPHMVDAFAATRRAQKFPRAASVRMSLSSVRSDTARRSRWFSFSSSFSRAS